MSSAPYFLRVATSGFVVLGSALPARLCAGVPRVSFGVAPKQSLLGFATCPVLYSEEKFAIGEDAFINALDAYATLFSSSHLRRHSLPQHREPRVQCSLSRQ